MFLQSCMLSSHIILLTAVCILTFSCMLGFAPAARRSSTTFWWPWKHASSKDVQPFYSECIIIVGKDLKCILSSYICPVCTIILLYNYVMHVATSKCSRLFSTPVCCLVASSQVQYSGELRHLTCHFAEKTR